MVSPINTVLVVDDAEDILFSYKIFLKEESQGLVDTLLTANMVDKAESLMQSSRDNWPQTIILDGNMPGKDPIDFISFLIDEGYTGELLICTDSEPKAEKMLQHIEQNKDRVKFQYADTKIHADKTNFTKGQFIANYLKSRGQSVEI